MDYFHYTVLYRRKKVDSSENTEVDSSSVSDQLNVDLECENNQNNSVFSVQMGGHATKSHGKHKREDNSCWMFSVQCLWDVKSRII